MSASLWTSGKKRQSPEVFLEEAWTGSAEAREGLQSGGGALGAGVGSVWEGSSAGFTAPWLSREFYSSGGSGKTVLLRQGEALFLIHPPLWTNQRLPQFPHLQQGCLSLPHHPPHTDFFLFQDMARPNVMLAKEARTRVWPASVSSSVKQCDTMIIRVGRPRDSRVCGPGPGSESQPPPRPRGLPPLCATPSASRYREQWP